MKENTLKIKRNKIGIKYSWIISQRMRIRCLNLIEWHRIQEI